MSNVKISNETRLLPGDVVRVLRGASHQVAAVLKGEDWASKAKPLDLWELTIRESAEPSVRVSAPTRRVCISVDLPSPTSKAGRDWYDDDGQMRPDYVSRFAALCVKALFRHWGWLSDGLRAEAQKPWWQVDTLWADGMRIRLKAEKKKPTSSERVAAREAHVRRMLARAEADEARASARVKRWAKKVRYYDNKKKKETTR